MSAPLPIGGAHPMRRSLSRQLLERTQAALDDEAAALWQIGHRCIVWDREYYFRIPLCCGHEPCVQHNGGDGANREYTTTEERNTLLATLAPIAPD
jgi:hypothetical protein